jgi:hypothetical protein
MTEAEEESCKHGEIAELRGEPECLAARKQIPVRGLANPAWTS